MKITNIDVFENYTLISASGYDMNEKLASMCIFIYDTEIALVALDSKSDIFNKRLPRDKTMSINNDNLRDYYLEAIMQGKKQFQPSDQTVTE